MTIEQLKRVLALQPFPTIVIHLADGREIPIDHSELIVMSKSGRTVTVHDKQGFEEIIDLLLVVSLKVVPHERHIHSRNGH